MLMMMLVIFAKDGDGDCDDDDNDDDIEVVTSCANSHLNSSLKQTTIPLLGIICLRLFAWFSIQSLSLSTVSTNSQIDERSYDFRSSLLMPERTESRSVSDGRLFDLIFIQ